MMTIGALTSYARPDRRAALVAVAAVAIAGSARAEPTLELRVSGAADVLEGDPESTSVDARGVIRAGLAATQLPGGVDAPITALLVAGGGVLAGTSGGGLHRFDLATGKATPALKAEKLVITALAAHQGKILAATGPDGRIVAVGKTDAGEPFADPAPKYVWSMLSDDKRLIIATGEPGGVSEIDTAGKITALFTPDETHVRALVRHPQRGIVAGGGSKGVVYQVRPNGGAYALYDSGMDEVTALAVDSKTGDLYAALVSESKAGAVLADKTIGPVAADPQDTSSAIKGSEVVRILPDGSSEVVWSSRREGALALTLDEGARRLFVATGGGAKVRGRIYAVDFADRDRVELVARVEQRIASALARGAGGALLVGTAPSGRLLSIGPAPRQQSVYVSAEQDLKGTGKIGRLWFDAELPSGSKVELALRAGNTKSVDDTWSPWSAVVTAADGAAVTVPDARFVQFRAVLSASPQGASPVLRSLHASVLRRNRPPRVEEVFLLREGVYLRPMPGEEEKEKTVTVSDSQLTRLRRSVGEDDPEVRARQGVLPGHATAAWRVEDPNKDSLVYRLEIRRAGSAAWRIIADDLPLDFHTFEASSYPDGDYQLRVTASDRPSNAPADALQDTNVSETIVLDHTPPKIVRVVARAVGSGVAIEAEAEDATSLLGEALFSVDGGPWLTLPARDRLTDARREVFSAELAVADGPGALKAVKGVRAVAVKVTDERGNTAVASTTFESK